MTASDPRVGEIQAEAIDVAAKEQWERTHAIRRPRNFPVEAVVAALAYCDEALRMCSTDPNQEGYDQGFDDAIRGMAAKVKRLLNGDRDIMRAAPADVAYLLAELRDRDEKLARVEALAEEWRYKGEFGWGAWQEGQGPDPEGYVLDTCAGEIRAAVAAANGGGDRG